ncbi:hypothetical protein IPC1135_29700 [Pseudomonas aeruginosa]|uniref:hypothetical protein n=1 Tax=Pseudomonas aeruginosa TaxID=287 RepID=UPI000FC40F69|nr:hypothetical protein [Pseudomonas aeruginosa]RUE86346.1 hypothetical protein IPC1135_29700 [Pseudomonas aeruginosa]
MTIGYPRPPDALVLGIAQEIVGKRYTTDHRDYNRLLQALSDRGLDHRLGFYGEDARTARPVVEYVAEQNLRIAPLKTLQGKIEALDRQVSASAAKSHSRVDITRLGGTGAAGRVRDQAHDSFRRDLLRMQRDRLLNEVARREADAGGPRPEAGYRPKHTQSCTLRK